MLKLTVCNIVNRRELKWTAEGKTEIECIQNLNDFILDKIYEKANEILNENLTDEDYENENFSKFDESVLPDALFIFCDRCGYEQKWEEI